MYLYVAQNHTYIGQHRSLPMDHCIPLQGTWHSTKPPPRHTEIGTVSLPASNSGMRVSEIGYKYWALYQYSLSHRQTQWPILHITKQSQGW